MLFRIVQLAVPFVWFGMVGAISFMEAPLKFRAPGITLPLGLGIGRLVFQTLNKIEIVLAATMLISVFMHRPSTKATVYSLGVVVALLLIETVWLLPVLDARAEEVINGTAGPGTNAHILYIAADAIKLILLLYLGISLSREHLRSAK